MHVLLLILRLSLSLRDVAKVFKHINEHRSLFLDISLEGVANKVHVDLPITWLLLLFLNIEGLLLIKVVKVLIRNL